MEKKNVIIAVLGLVCIVLGYIAFKPAPPIDNSFIQSRIDSIERQNKQLLASAQIAEHENDSLRALNDSLVKLPPKIKTKYVNVYAKIDRLDNHDVIDTLNSIFVQNNVDTVRKDTLIYISPTESKYLIKEHYRNGELSELLKVDEAINKNLIQEVTNDSLQIKDYKGVVKNDREESSLKDAEILGLTKEMKHKDRQILKQKILKWLGITAGVLATGYMGYLNIKAARP